MTLTHLDLDRIEGLAGRLREISQQIDDWAANKIGLIDWGRNQVDIDAAARTLDDLTALITRIRELEGALGELVDTLASSEQVPIKDLAYGDMVRELGKRIGFGALMSAASCEWRAVLAERGDPLGSEFVSGPCRAVLEHDMARARTALQRKTP